MNKEELLKEIYFLSKKLADSEVLPSTCGINISRNAQKYTAEFFLEVFEKHNYKPEAENE